MFWKLGLLLSLIGCVGKDISADLPKKQLALLGATHIIIETKADGTGTEVEAVNFQADDDPVTFYAIARNDQGFFISNSEPVVWSITGGIGTIVSMGSSVSFTPTGAGTGTITADHASLDDDLTGTLTVENGVGNRISIESAADGSGIELTTETLVRGGPPQTFYAVLRDSDNNFVSGNEVVTWSHSNPAVGSLSATQGGSVVFTATSFGTTIITAASDDYADDSTGLLTVGVGPATTLSIEDKADGTGTAPAVFDLVHTGLAKTVYAIARDAGGNFVNNSTSASWSSSTSPFSLSSATGSSVSLSPSNLGSAVLTATATGLTSDRIESVRVNPGVKTLSSRREAACVLRTNNEVKCWGRNNQGRLGLGDTSDRGDDPAEMGANLPAVNLGNISTVTDIKTGHVHACALFTNGGLKCWGGNTQGQLGLEDTNDRGDGPGEMGNSLPFVNLGFGRTVKSFDTYSTFNCAILDNDKVKCWGQNSFGGLGLGDTVDRGDTFGSMGDNLPYVDLGTGRTAKKISVGESHACAILDDDKLKCWGRGSDGRLGYGNTSNIGANPGEMGDSLAPVDLGTRTAKEVSAGNSHTCVILTDGNGLCFGYNLNGQLIIGNTDSRGDDITEIGSNFELAKVGAGRSILEISAGRFSTCVLMDNFEVKCFGSNSKGQLGQESLLDLGDEGSEVNDLVPSINLGTNLLGRSVSQGKEATCVLLNSAEVKCFGEGQYGLPGQGIGLDIGDDPGEMGDSLPIIQLQ